MSAPIAPATAGAKYVPRAKLEAEKAAAAAGTTLDATPPKETKETETVYTQADLDDFTPARKFFYDSSDVFKKLQHAKKAFGDKPEVENMFNQHRANNMDKKVTTKFADQFYVCMDDINDTAGSLLTNNSVKAYMDLGCSPGGFSSWVMAHNKQSRGLGVTLPEESGGLPMVSFPDGDYEVKYQDVTQLDVVRALAKERHPNGVDLVMAACIYRDNETALPRSDNSAPVETRTPPGARTTLALSQIILALDHLVEHGHFVFVLSNKPDPATIQCLVFLRKLFRNITPCKGKSLHGIRSSFYLFCEDFNRAAYESTGASQVLAEALTKVEDAQVAFLAEQMTISETPDAATPAKQTGAHPADAMWLPGLTLEAMLEQEGDFVSSFFDKLWIGQIKAIDRRMQELDYKKKSSYGPKYGPGAEAAGWRKQEQHKEAGASKANANNWRKADAPSPRANWVAPSSAKAGNKDEQPHNGSNSGRANWAAPASAKASTKDEQSHNGSNTGRWQPTKAPKSQQQQQDSPQRGSFPKRTPQQQNEAESSPRGTFVRRESDHRAPSRPGPQRVSSDRKESPAAASKQPAPAPAPTRSTILANNPPFKSAFAWSSRPIGKSLPPQ